MRFLLQVFKAPANKLYADHPAQGHSSPGFHVDTDVVRKYDAPIRTGIGAQRSLAATEIARQIYTALIKRKQIYAGIAKEYSQPMTSIS